MTDIAQQNEILFSINPDCCRCDSCLKLFNAQTHKKILAQIIGSRPFLSSYLINNAENCLDCIYLHKYQFSPIKMGAKISILNHLEEDLNLSLIELEKLFGDVYDIEQTINKTSLRFTRKR